MKIKLNIQKDGENLIKDTLIKRSEAKPKKVYFYMGNIKESGFEILEECLIDLKARKLIIIGVDKKNTTKKMLDTLLGYTKSIYIHNNNGVVEFDSNIAVFEHEEKAYVYIMNANVSDSTFVDDIATYTELEFDLTNKEDVSQYKEYVEGLVSISKFEEVIKLDKDVIKDLFDNAQIFTTKQYTHSVMTIAELLGDKPEIKKEEVKSDDVEIVENSKAKLPKIDLGDIEDFSIDIDIDDSVKREEEIVEKEEVKKEKKKEERKEKVTENVVPELENVVEDTEFDANDVLDIESMLFEKADIKLDKDSIDKKLSEENEEDKATSKKIDLAKVSNLIMQLPKKASKGREVSCIKVPNYIKYMIPDFFSAMIKHKTVEKDGAMYKESKITLEVVDVLNGEKYVDKNAKLLHKTGQTYIMFESDCLENIKYEENDIVRVIKLDNDTYHIEIVPQDVQEYKIWKKLCTNNFKGSSRSYGVM